MAIRKANEVCAYCDQPAVYNGRGSLASTVPEPLCNTHYMRHRRGLSLTAPVKRVYADAWHRLTDAALAYANAETDQEVENAAMRLRTAARAHAIRLE